MSEYYEFRFKINDLTLRLNTMARVLEYLSDLAVLVSKTEDIHLHAIRIWEYRHSDSRFPKGNGGKN